MRFAGIDLAWGERNGDGLCLLEAWDGAARLVETAHVLGDVALLGWLAARLPAAPVPARLLFDAPRGCPPAPGTRLADRQTHVRCGRFHGPPAAARRAEFARMQRLLAACLRERFGELEENACLAEVLSAPWTKPAEDRLDALLCALVGYHHWKHDGTRSEVLGDLATGFIVVPAAD